MYVGREIEEEEKGELEASPRRLNKGALAPFCPQQALKAPQWEFIILTLQRR